MCTVPSNSVNKLDIASCLKCYISRSRADDQIDLPLFLHLKQPVGLKASSISVILRKALSLAGLSGFQAKDFRPTGATQSVRSGENVENVRMLGRWKTASVFMEHYVHSQPSTDYSDNLL